MANRMWDLFIVIRDAFCHAEKGGTAVDYDPTDNAAFQRVSLALENGTVPVEMTKAVERLYMLDHEFRDGEWHPTTSVRISVLGSPMPDGDDAMWHKAVERLTRNGYVYSEANKSWQLPKAVSFASLLDTLSAIRERTKGFVAGGIYDEVNRMAYEALTGVSPEVESRIERLRKIAELAQRATARSDTPISNLYTTLIEIEKVARG